MAQSKKSGLSVKSIAFAGVMAALIFVFTFIVQIPTGTGYVHMGDTMIFLAVILIGTKRSIPAAGIGAALADIISGYANYALPTFIIKAIMALICGLIFEKLFNGKFLGFIIGGAIGGLFEVFGYAVTKIILYGELGGIASTVPDLFQALFGIGVATIIAGIFYKTKTLQKLQKMAK